MQLRWLPVLIAISSFSLFLGISSLHAQKHDGLPWYADAERARKKEMYPKAIENYNEALRREPDNYRYLYGKAWVLSKLRKQEDALALLNKAVRIRGNYAPIYALMAEIYESYKKDAERAAQLYDIAFKNEKDEKERLHYKFKVINYHIAQKDYEGALRHIREAKIFALKNPRVHYLDAQVSNLLERYSSAEATIMVVMPYLKTLHISESARFFYELGYAYYMQKKYDQAYGAWKRAYYGEFKARIQRYQPGYFFRLASAHAGFYDLEKSHELLNHLLTITPNMANAYLLQVELLKKEAQQPQLLALYEKALGLTSNNKQKAHICLDIAELHAKSKNFEACLKRAREGIGYVETMPELYFFEVIALFQLNRAIESRKSLELLIRNTRFSSKKSLYVYLLGKTYAMKDNPRKALELFAQVEEEPYKSAAEEATFKLKNGPEVY